MSSVEKAAIFFQKHRVQIGNLKYILSDTPRVVFYYLDGRTLQTTSLTLKDVFAALPEGEFIHVQKGVLLSCRQIVDISPRGLYTMTDGKTFLGRQRCLKEHKRNRELLRHKPISSGSASDIPLSLLEKCSLMDNMPIAFCIIELVFDKNGHGIDFLFRYCNKEMENLEGVPITEMLNRSFYEVFKNGDPKWLVAYADVALNGSKRILHDYSPEIGKTLSIYCYQPLEGYCACTLFVSE